MTFLIRPPHRIKKKQTKEAQGILDNLAKYLDESSEEPVEMLCGFWKDQQDAITYQELRVAVQDGALSEGTFKQWSNDYSVLVQKQLTPIWNNAIEVGSHSQPIVSDLEFAFNTQTPGLMRWISERGAEFVTASTVDQRKAIASLLAKKVTDEHTVDELARLIRPCIGLTDGDSKATLRYYDNIVKTLKEQHPRMKPESVRKKALDAATKYAEKKHRARAFTIAQTEMAFAYNRGADEGVRQAQQNNLLGVCEKRWITSGDDQVCPTCAALDGTQIGMDDNFDFKGRLLFTGQKLVPPAHPRCGCAVEYIEVSAPVFEQEQTITELPNEGAAYKEMTEDEYKEWQKENSTEKKILSDFEKQYGVKLNRDGELNFKDDEYIESEGEWLADILDKRKNDLYQVQNGQGHCGYIQASDGSKAINAYLRRKEVGMYRKNEMEETIDSLKRLIDSTTLHENITVDRWAGIDALERMGIDAGAHGKTTRIGHAFATDGIDFSAVLEGVNSKMVGKEIVDKGFMSASACSSANVFQGSDVKFKIQVPAGTKAFVSENTLESELVFSPGTKQEMLSARIIETEAKNYDDEMVSRKSIEILVRIVEG